MTPEVYDTQVERIYEKARELELPFEAVEAALEELNDRYADENAQAYQDRGEAAAHRYGAWA
jgi:hypothetical protein